MNLTQILSGMVQNAVASNTTDKYGLYSGPKLGVKNESTSSVYYSSLSGSNSTWRKFDEVSEVAERRHGDFNSPTAYYCAQTLYKGNAGMPVEITQSATRPVKTLLVTVTPPRKGSVETFNLLPGVNDVAAAKLNAKLINGANQWAALVDAAELGQSVSLLRDLSSSLLGISVAIVKRDPRLLLESFGITPSRPRVRKASRHLTRAISRSKNVGDAAANLWLQYRYGILPAVYSLEDMVKAFTESYDPAFEVQVTYPETLEYVAASSTVSVTSTLAYDRKEYASIKRSCRLRARVSFRSDLSARILGNPYFSLLSTGYELIPYSFMLDWVVGIGPWLQSLQLESLLSSVRVERTTKGSARFTSVVENVRVTPNWPTGFFVPRGESPSVSSETRSFRREVLHDLPVAPIQLGTGLSQIQRSLDLLALTFSKVRRLNSSTFK